MEIEINVAAPQDTQCMVLSVSQAQLDQLDLRDLLDLPVRLPRQYMHNKENAVTMRLSAH